MTMIYDEYFSTWDEFKLGVDIRELIKCPHCDAKRYDKYRNRIPLIFRYCKFKTCVQYFCNSCKRWDGGWGRILCPCEMGRNVHTTYHEFSKPAGRKNVRTQLKWNAIK